MSHGAAKQWAIKGAIAFVIIAGGVFAGVTIALQLDLPGVYRQTKLEDKIPQTFRPEQQLPVIAVTDSDGTLVDLRLKIQSSTIVAFLSPTCGPCQEFAAAVGKAPAIVDGKHHVIIVSTDPSVFTQYASITYLHTSDSELKRLGIALFPFYVRVGGDGVIMSATAAFTATRLPEFFTT